MADWTCGIDVRGGCPFVTLEVFELPPLIGVANENLASRFPSHIFTQKHKHISNIESHAKCLQIHKFVYASTSALRHHNRNTVSECVCASVGICCYYYYVANIKSVLNSLYTSNTRPNALSGSRPCKYMQIVELFTAISWCRFIKMTTTTKSPLDEVTQVEPI